VRSQNHKYSPVNSIGFIGNKRFSSVNKFTLIPLIYIYQLSRQKSNASNEQIREFERWMYSIAGELLPKSLLAKAINYTFSMLPRLTRYVTDARFVIDNNPVENSIRPMAIGRKNYLFCGNHRAARDAAMYYTFFGCCKLSNANQTGWLTYVLNNINQTKINEIQKLFPENWNASIQANPET